MVQPETWETAWQINQQAATLWYHPHPHGATERHVYQGIAEFFLIDDAEEATLNLPHTYGVDDVPLLVQDKSFDSSGQLIESARRNNGMLGGTILVNGTANPIFEATAELTRLRILNGSSARTYSFGFSDGREFLLIATDGGLLSEPVAMNRVRLTPGERAEVVVKMVPSEEVTLRSFPHELGVSRGMARVTGALDELDVMLLRSSDRLTTSAAIPTPLANIERLREIDAAEHRTFELRTNRINGLPMDMSRIDEVVTVGNTEVWEVWNDHGQPHNFHIHDVQFQILSIDHKPPPAELAGWKDTVYLEPHKRVQLIMKFSDYTSTEVPYMYHCHLLWHEDQGMMGQFVVVSPGEEGDVSIHEHPRSNIGHEHSGH